MAEFTRIFAANTRRQFFFVITTATNTRCLVESFQLICYSQRVSATWQYEESGRTIGWPGFLPGILSGVGKIYCYANFFCYANFSVVLGPNFRGQKSLRGELLEGGTPCGGKLDGCSGETLLALAQRRRSCRER